MDARARAREVPKAEVGAECHADQRQRFDACLVMRRLDPRDVRRVKSRDRARRDSSPTGRRGDSGERLLMTSTRCRRLGVDEGETMLLSSWVVPATVPSTSYGFIRYKFPTVR
jgi:hypothetical protein